MPYIKERLVIKVNGNSVLEYDREKVLPENQAAFLDQLDRDMDTGIVLGENTVAKPDALQRAQFIANALVGAVKSDNEPLIAATCAYLATRIPGLQQIKADDHADGTVIDLVFSGDQNPSVRVNFDPTLATKTRLH